MVFLTPVADRKLTFTVRDLQDVQEALSKLLEECEKALIEKSEVRIEFIKYGHCEAHAS